VKKSRKVGASDATRKSATKKGKKISGSAISTSSPLGMLALHLREQWKKFGRDGLVFLAEDENRAERLGGIVHALDPSLDVLVFPRLNTLPFDGLEPSREIAGRRSSVLRRLARRKRPILLISTAEAIMERLPLPASWSRISLSLKVRASYAEHDLEARIAELGYDLDEEAEYPGAALFHGATFEIFPAGALGPYRIEHSGGAIRRIVAVDPNEHDVISDFKELIIDPMSERLALGGDRAQRATFLDYCDRARWFADAKVPAHADSWLSTIEEAAGRRDSEREYLGRGDWKKLKKRTSVLPAKAAFALRRRGRRRSARDGAHEWGQGGAFRQLGRGGGGQKTRGRAVGRLRRGLFRSREKADLGCDRV
jgi:transcription-repair coupling factor (superfamily II helicase)